MSEDTEIIVLMATMGRPDVVADKLLEENDEGITYVVSYSKHGVPTRQLMRAHKESDITAYVGEVDDLRIERLTADDDLLRDGAHFLYSVVE